MCALSSCFQKELQHSGISFPKESTVIAIQEDTGIERPAPGVLADFNIDSAEQYSVRVLSDVFNGELELNPNGAFAYKPAEDFYGTDSFLYQLLDKDNVIYTGTVQFDIANIPDSPKPQPDSYEIKEDALLIKAAPGVLENDRDPDGGQLHLRLLEKPAHGELTLNPDGGFRFRPELNWSGEVVFTYEVQSGDKVSDPVPVTFVVTPVNDRPRLRLGTMQIKEGDALQLTADHIFAQDADDNDAALKFSVKNVQHGRFELKQNPGKGLKAFSQSHIEKGNVTFIHNKSNNPPNFTVVVSDGKLEVEQRMTIQFEEVNDEPHWKKVGFPIKEGGRTPLNARYIFALDEETTADELVFTVKSQAGVQLVDKDDKPLTQVSLKDIRAEAVFAQHDGSETKPKMVLSLSDGTHHIERHLKIPYTAVNDAPKWAESAFDITQGQQVSLNAKQLNIQDEDNQPKELVIKVLQAEHLRFAHVGAPDTAIHQWSNHALREGQIIAIHDGANDAPRCVLQVSDGKAQSDQTVKIGFTRVFKAPQIESAQHVHATFERLGGALDAPAAAPAVISLPIGKDLQLQFKDEDGDSLERVDLTLLGALSDAEQLELSHGDEISAEWVAGTLHLRGTASLSVYQQVLSSLRYRSLPLMNGTIKRTVHVTAHDAQLSSAVHVIEFELLVTEPAPELEPTPSAESEAIEVEVTPELEKVELPESAPAPTAVPTVAPKPTADEAVDVPAE